jgi:hypothetical protein
VQAVPQQTPCWQNPEAHSAPVVHAVASPFLVQMPMMQVLGETQSPSAVQVALQARPPGSHWKPPHEETVAARQTPAPSQVRAEVNIAVGSAQLGPTHWVPAANTRHAPAPLHDPSLPQLATGSGSHWLNGS